LSSSQSRRPKARPTTSSTMSFAMLECSTIRAYSNVRRDAIDAREEGARHLIRSRADPKGEEVTTFRPGLASSRCRVRRARGAGSGPSALRRETRCQGTEFPSGFSWDPAIFAPWAGLPGHRSQDRHRTKHA
jgi:hypothetical protein